MARKCDGCTKCCEGWLSGQAHGKSFWPGRPCHFVGKGGCTIYNDRPENPCRVFQCEWLQNADIPEWLKPDQQGIIIVACETNGVKYWRIEEAGNKITVEVLSWIVTYAMGAKINFMYSIGKGHYKLGSPEFAALDLPN